MKRINIWKDFLFHDISTHVQNFKSVKSSSAFDEAFQSCTRYTIEKTWQPLLLELLQSKVEIQKQVWSNHMRNASTLVWLLTSIALRDEVSREFEDRKSFAKIQYPAKNELCRRNTISMKKDYKAKTQKGESSLASVLKGVISSPLISIKSIKTVRKRRSKQAGYSEMGFECIRDQNERWPSHTRKKQYLVLKNLKYLFSSEIIAPVDSLKLLGKWMYKNNIPLHSLKKGLKNNQEILSMNFNEGELDVTFEVERTSSSASDEIGKLL